MAIHHAHRAKGPAIHSAAANARIGTMIPFTPNRQPASIDAATAMGTDSHSAAHGAGVCIANSESSRTSKAVRTHERNARDREALAVDVTAERQQRQDAGALDRSRELLLVTRAGARHAPRHDLAAIRDEAAQALLVLVVDVPHLLQAELAVLLLESSAFSVLRHR